MKKSIMCIIMRMGKARSIRYCTTSFMSVSFVFIMLFSLNSFAQGKDPKRVIILETMPVKAVLEHTRWFVQQLKDMGYREGKDIEISILKADGDRGKAETLLKNALAKGRPDLVVTNATLASQTAAKLLKGTDIPQLFFTVSDPVGAGLISEIGVPTETNITGKVNTINRNTKVDMVIRLAGQTTERRPIRFGIIHSTYPSAMGDVRELMKIATKRDDIVFLPYQIKYRKVPDELAPMMQDTFKGIETLKGKIDFWWEPLGPLGELDEYTKELQNRSGITVVLGTKPSSVQLGALLNISPDIEASGRETAMLADAILKGADPGDIPPNPPMTFNVGLNLGTALKMNIVVPPDILELAEGHIYRKQ